MTQPAPQNTDFTGQLWLRPECANCTKYDEENQNWSTLPIYDDCPKCGKAPTKYIRADLVKEG